MIIERGDNITNYTQVFKTIEAYNRSDRWIEERGRGRREVERGSGDRSRVEGSEERK